MNQFADWRNSKLETRNSKTETRSSLNYPRGAHFPVSVSAGFGLKMNQFADFENRTRNSKVETRESPIANRQSSIRNQQSAIVNPKSSIDSFAPLKTDPRAHTPPHRLSVFPGEIMNQFADLRNSKLEIRNSRITNR